jgi:hypothetical protein
MVGKSIMRIDKDIALNDNLKRMIKKTQCAILSVEY